MISCFARFAINGSFYPEYKWNCRKEFGYLIHVFNTSAVDTRTTTTRRTSTISTTTTTRPASTTGSTTSTATANPDESVTKKEGFATGPVVGGILAGIVVLLALVIVVLIVWRRRRGLRISHAAGQDSLYMLGETAATVFYELFSASVTSRRQLEVDFTALLTPKHQVSGHCIDKWIPCCI
jgi:hypothetical protein